MSDIHSEVVIMMDTLDLDEEVVDRRLNLLMSKTEYTADHFKTMLFLLQYKYSINVKEDDDCENKTEISFIPKLISSVNEKNVNYVAKIVSTSLLLNKESLLFNAEHLLQQIMPEFALSYPHVAHTISQIDLVRIVNLLKITDAVFDAVLSINSKLHSIYNETPLEHLLYSRYKPLTIQLLNHTIPKMFKSLQDYNILDRIWEFVERRNASHNNIDYEIITGLSDFYLPVNIGLADIYESSVVTKPTFWHLIFKGLYSSDTSLRKYSLFFLKRMLDSVMSKKRNLKVDFEGDLIFTWTSGKSGEVQRCWNNYFILMESLQEKQSNIVVSSLPLLLQLLELHERWIHSALFLALQHESSIVVKVAVEYSLKFPFTKTFPVEQFLLALNNNLFFEEVIDVEGHVSIRNLLVTSFSEDLQKLIQVVRYLNQIPWSPVSRFYMSCILCCITNCKKITKQQTNEILITATQVKGNNLLLKLASKCCYLQFMVNCGYAIELTILSSLLNDFSKNMLLIDSQLRRSLVKWIRKVYEHFPINYQDLINHQDFQNRLKTQNVFYLFMIAFPERENILKSFVMNSLQNVDNINARQYAAVNDCADDLLFITGLLNKLQPTVNNLEQSCNLSVINNLICHNFNSILKYISKYLMGISDIMSFEVLRACTESFNSMVSINPKCYCDDVLIELNKLAILSLQTEHDNYAQKSFAARILAKLYSAQFNKTTNLNIYKLDTITCFHFLKKVGYENSKIISHDKIQKGKLRSFYNESLCELFFVLLSNDIAKQSPSPEEILPVIDAVLEVGGHGCLMWILKIYAIIFHDLLLRDSHVAVIEFIEKCWKLTMELKSNEQFKPCLNAYIEIILSKQIICTKKMHEVIHKYVEAILEFGLSSNASSRYLVDYISKNLKDLNEPILFEVIGKLLLFGNVPRKDQRIEQKTCLSIMADEQKYPIKEEYYTDASIRNMALKFLIESNSPEIYGAVSKILRQNIDSKFKSKKRYHANSLHHRLLTRSVQHLLSIFLIKPTCTEVKNAVYWCVDLLEKLPHQPSVKMYLEWFIAVYIIIQDINLDSKVGKELENIPQTSRFLILYHVIKHKMKMRLCSSNDFSFVMDYLLSFSMAQIFNIRLHAQYLALALNSLHKTLNLETERKYDQICSVIQKTFDVSSSEKSLIKMRADIYFNNFDIIFYLNPAIIYHHVPILHCAATDEIINQIELPTIDQYVKRIRQNYENAKIENKSWNYLHRCLTSSDAVISFSVNMNFSLENSRGDYDILIHDKEDVMYASIQKKYVPWKRMLADMDVSGITASLNKKPESASNLIVVATLIDRLPNLGGIARTCEVFGVSKYVVDYKRLLQDKEFKSLSVSAERWLDIEEIRPENLKKYINDMKNDGYSIIAAEQTSNSSSLESFKFPKNTVLILGHEKDGVPCDILPLMEHCVEIPQKGLIRSLNVHVAASIFIWEYTKQHSKQIKF